MYLSTDKGCLPCPTGCATCCPRSSLTAIICSSCSKGFILIGGVCVKTIGCKTRLGNSNKCLECLDGYYLDQELVCSECDISCKTCKTKYDCIECAPSKYIKTPTFPYICISCNCPAGESCDSHGTCSKE